MVYPEEIEHCRAGVTWLRHLHAHAHALPGDAGSVPEWARWARRFSRVECWFQWLVKRHLYGVLRPPFNVPAREAAGFEPSWYEPLSDHALDPQPDLP